MIGLHPFSFKLVAFVLASFLATAGGVVWLLVLGTGASPQVTTASFTLTLLVMVVLGGAGTRYGALLGGFLYTLADQRLGALAGHSTIEKLPSVLSTPLSEPLFILGTLFILLVFFVPGGLAEPGPPDSGDAPRPSAWRGSSEDRLGAPRRGPPLLLIHGPRLRALGLGAGRRAARALVRRAPLRQPRHRRQRRAARPVHGGADGRGRRPGARRGRGRACARRRNEPRRHGRPGARARAAGAGRAARARLHDAGRRAGVPDAAANGRADGRAARACASTSRTRSSPTLDPELVDRILGHREQTAQPFEAWAAQAAAGAGFDAHDRLGAHRGADARPARRRRRRRRPAQRRPARRLRSPTPASRSSPAAGTSSSGRSPSASPASSEEFLC